MLNENQLKLLRHLSRFNLLDYPSCLDMLNNDGGSDRTALSYAFRPLTKTDMFPRISAAACLFWQRGGRCFLSLSRCSPPEAVSRQGRGSWRYPAWRR